MTRNHLSKPSEGDVRAGLWITRANYEENRDHYDSLGYDIHIIDDEAGRK